MTADSCRWHQDNGRCANPLAFPDVEEVPELCTFHLNALEEGWIRLRVAARRTAGAEWSEWAARRAAVAEVDRQALRTDPPGRTVADRRPARPAPPT